jgi:hypothetical protein
MLSILSEVEGYTGAQYSAISWKGALVASTCPAQMHRDLARVQVAMRQLIDGAQKSGYDYKELHMLFDRHLVVAFQLSEHCSLLLITKKGVNLALLATGARNVRERLLTFLENATPDQIAAVQSDTQTQQDNEDHSALTALMSRLSDLLVDAIGPSGAVIFYQVMNEWKQANGFNKYKLPHLLKALAAEVPELQARERFLAKAVTEVRTVL